MTILVDASALVAMATHEPEALALGERIDRHADRLCCAAGFWEAARAIARKRTIGAVQAGKMLELLLADLQMRIVPVGEEEARLALRAHDLYGKGSGHPARLNMGDCFAYACAKTNKARLLYKGDDFAKTDLA